MNWCHEAGHSVGLDHHPAVVTDRDLYYDGATADREQDCMVSGHIEFDQQWMRVNPHRRSHINAAY